MTAHERTAKANIRTYERSQWRNLYEAYGSHSAAKEQAWRYCENLMAKYKGWDLKVVSKNSFIFTAGFTFADPETGVLRYMHITPNYDVAVDL